jgi:hypothetical protein
MCDTPGPLAVDTVAATPDPADCAAAVLPSPIPAGVKAWAPLRPSGSRSSQGSRVRVRPVTAPVYRSSILLLFPSPGHENDSAEEPGLFYRGDQYDDGTTTMGALSVATFLVALKYEDLAPVS